MMALKNGHSSSNGSNGNMKKKKMMMMKSSKDGSSLLLLFDISSIFGWNKSTYRHVAAEFHIYHQHHFNVFLHLLTTPLGVWGALQLVLILLGSDGDDGNGSSSSSSSSSDFTNNAGLAVIAVYTALIAVTTPLFWTALLHTAFMYALVFVAPSARDVAGDYFSSTSSQLSPLQQELLVSALAIAAGYGLQDAAHWACMEPTYMDSYMKGSVVKKDDDNKNMVQRKDAQPWMLVVHSIWLLALVIDSVTMRYCFIPQLLVSRNRCVVVDTVANRQACDDLRAWINRNVPSTCAVTTHVWPHDNKTETSPQTVALENDAAILAGFRKVFDAQHYDVRPVQGMNEIYVTAVGAKKEINSDAVFYTPHTDGPYWFLPQASLYRVLVGLTPNTMVRTRFNLQHASTGGDQVMDIYGVVGFDYNRELHWIDHVPGQTNRERRSLLKLHYIVYPKGWHVYGRVCAVLNQNYNTWARGNFLKTLRPSGAYEYVLAWWIWLTTWTNAVFEEHFGWANLVYIGLCYALSVATGNKLVFEVLTSFRHYAIYIATFAFRHPQPPVAHGYFMRDAKLYKTISMMHLGRRLLPLVQLPQDTIGVLAAVLGFGITVLATARLGMVRTYFGSELNLVKPQWIVGFPYGYIPHPMIVGQLLAFASILVWFYLRLTTETVAMISAHMMCYSIHMIQEIFTSSY